MKFFALAALLAMATFGGTALAADTELTVTVGAESSYLYRGVDLSGGDDLSLNAGFRLDNAVIEGVYIRANGNTIDLGNDIQTGDVRVDGGIGYATNFGRLDVDVSLNRVVNPVLYAYDYTEARAQVGLNVTQNLNVYGLVGQQIGDSSNEDTYVAVGVKVDNFLGVDALSAGVQAAGYRYNDTRFNDTKYNNTEVFASYAVNDSVSLYGRYSFGGDGRYGPELANVGTIGLNVTF